MIITTVSRAISIQSIYTLRSMYMEINMYIQISYIYIYMYTCIIYTKRYTHMYLGDIQYELGVARASINVPSPEAAIRYQTLGAPRFKHAVPPPTVWYVYAFIPSTLQTLQPIETQPNTDACSLMFIINNFSIHVCENYVYCI